MNILSVIGHTPLVKFNNLIENSKVKIFGKLEGCNPGGSIKDRPAYYMIKKAEESGELSREKIILEPTSGNTGIALAMIGAAKGYKVKLCMPECVSVCGDDQFCRDRLLREEELLASGCPTDETCSLERMRIDRFMQEIVVAQKEDYRTEGTLWNEGRVGKN